MSPSQKKMIETLAQEILRHKALYYEGYPEISDQDYDRLEEKLRSLDPHHSVLVTVGSEQTKTSKNKKTHTKPMLSLAKTYNFDDLVSWQKKRELIGTPKIDGNSLSLIYKEGKLVLAKTRGNGIEGEDATQKIQWVTDCPKELTPKSFETIKKLSKSLDLEIEVRGELYCKESKFLELLEKMTSLGLPKATSPRNIVAGILGRKQHIHLARYFNFFAFDTLFSEPTSTFFTTETQKIQWMKDAGLSYPPFSLLKTQKELQSFLNEIKQTMTSQDYGTDGAVFSFNDLTYHETLGETSHHPRYKMSFKWQGETATTVIKDITWATSRLGIVTPVAQIEPTVLSDATITNVTLHNMAHVKIFKLKKGDQIEIVRSGEVIPKFIRVVNQNAGEPTLPTNCPSCKSPLTQDEVRLICESTECHAQKLYSILNWIKRVGIDDLSEKRLLALMEQKKVKEISDLYTLSKEDFLELPLTKEKLATKLFNSITDSKHMDLVNFLCGLGIEGSGKTTWLNLLKHFPTLEKISTATKEDLIALDGFAEKTAEQIISGLKSHKKLIEKLLELGVKPKAPQNTKSGNSLAGMSFVLTGTLSKPRDELTDLLIQEGAKVSGSVTKKTTALVSSDFSKKSSKTEKAKKLSVPLWSEEELMKLVKEKTK